MSLKFQGAHKYTNNEAKVLWAPGAVSRPGMQWPDVERLIVSLCGGLG